MCTPLNAYKITSHLLCACVRVRIQNFNFWSLRKSPKILNIQRKMNKKHKKYYKENVDILRVNELTFVVRHKLKKEIKNVC